MAAALTAAGYRVHAIDLPGFGSSSKPATAPYSARWFSETVRDVMDALGISRAHVVGNSMGGRVALEVGLRWPERVQALVLLCPAVAWVRRDFPLVVRLLRPEIGLLPHRFTRSMVAAQFWGMFADADRVDPSVADIVVDEFQRIYASPGARLAFLAAARNIYLDQPFGRGGFYPRLAGLESPALFVWGTEDRLVPTGFKRHVAQWLPGAEQIVLDECGHVPQVERPEQTNGLVQRFFARADALGAGRPTVPAARRRPAA
jgi:pimeloyl-ACP methyl ester carboxylesterase